MKRFNILAQTKGGGTVRETQAPTMQHVINEIHKGAMQLFGQDVEVQGLKFENETLVDLTVFQKNRFGNVILVEVTITQLN